MNTRLQVEHPVTEMVTGVDLVQWQIRIARGERLDLDPEALLTPTRRTRSSAASTPRIPTTASCRRPAASRALRVPQGPGVRDDSGAYEGGEVPIFYDPMISKLITWGDDRATRASHRMRRALSEYQVRGIRTTIPFFQWILDDEDFVAARFDTSFIDRKMGEPAARRCSRSTPRMKTSPRSPPPCTCSRSRPSRDRGGAGPVSRWRDAGRAEALR